MIRYAITALAITLLACAEEPIHPRAKASKELTATYAESRLAGWRIEATAIDRSQQTLLIVVQQPLDDGTVEALHYGVSGSVYDVTGDGRGVAGYALDHGFRSVVWRDQRGQEWPYGVTR